MVGDGRCKCVGFMQNLGEGQTSRLMKAGIMGCGDGGCGAGCVFVGQILDSGR